MKIAIALVVLTVAAAASTNASSAAQDRAARFAAIDACVSDAKRMAPAGSTLNDSAVMRRRTRLYTACMRDKGLRP